MVGPRLHLLDHLRVVPWDNIPHSSPQVFGKRVDVLYFNDSDENLLLGYERSLAEFVFS